MRTLHSKYRTVGSIRMLPLMLLLTLVVGLSGCKTSRKVTSSLGEPRFLSSKVQLTIPNKGGTITVNGTMKLVSGDVQATRKELKDVLPKKADFAHLEKMLFEAAKPGGKASLTGKELGIPSLEKGKIVLTDFSDKEISLTPTQVSSRYTKVEWTELLEMLAKL